MSGRRKKRILPGMIWLLILAGIIAAGVRYGREIFSEVYGKTQEVIGTAVESTVPFSEVEVAEEEVSDGYYYQVLESAGNEEAVTVYKELYQGVKEQQESFYIHASDSDLIGQIYQEILYDRPEIFWCTGEMQIMSYSTYAEVTPTYSCTGEEKAQKEAEIEAAAQECLSGISSEASEYECVKYVFEYIVNTVDYDLNSSDNQNIYSALVNKVSVCAGYSRAAQYLLHRMGVECIYVTGTITGQGAHAWNIVKCDGQYYQMDVTFGDPVFMSEESGESMPSNSINYGYLCCTDEEIYQNHTPDTAVTFPTCTSTDLNYYRLNGMYYETYDPEQILQAMNESIYSGEMSFSCKFATDELYEQAREGIRNDLSSAAAQTLARFYGLSSVQYMYMEDEVMNVITLYWNYEA